MRERTGRIYSEMTNKGRSSVRYVRGAAPVYCFRWVAEVMIHDNRPGCLCGSAGPAFE